MLRISSRAYYLPGEDIAYSVHHNGCFGLAIIALQL